MPIFSGWPSAPSRGAATGDTQAALVAMRPDGRVVAMVGGKSYKESPFNRATQARRQPGSAFKLFVYLAALRAGWTPDSMIEDRPITIGGWTPGQQRRRLSRARSRCAKRSPDRATRQRSGCRKASAAPTCIRAARELGITTPLPNSPSVALGTAGVSLLELTSAYAAVASGRYPIRARGLPEKEAAGRFGGLLQSGGSTRFAPRLGADARPALRGGEQRHRQARRAWPCRRSARPEPARIIATPCSSASPAIWSSGVWVGRDDDKPLGRKVSGGTVPGADLAQLHGLGACRRRPRRARLAGGVPSPGARPAAPRARKPAARGLERRRGAASRDYSRAGEAASNEGK